MAPRIFRVPWPTGAAALPAPTSPPGSDENHRSSPGLQGTHRVRGTRIGHALLGEKPLAAHQHPRSSTSASAPRPGRARVSAASANVSPSARARPTMAATRGCSLRASTAAAMVSPRAGSVPSSGALRPEETRGHLEEKLTGDEAAEEEARLRRVGPGIPTVQGESIHWISGPGRRARVPRDTVCPLESRTRRWAHSSRRRRGPGRSRFGRATVLAGPQ
jgi:hypothetical protein